MNEAAIAWKVLSGGWAIPAAMGAEKAQAFTTWFAGEVQTSLRELGVAK